MCNIFKTIHRDPNDTVISCDLKILWSQISGYVKLFSATPLTSNSNVSKYRIYQSKFFVLTRITLWKSVGLSQTAKCYKRQNSANSFDSLPCKLEYGISSVFLRYQLIISYINITFAIVLYWQLLFDFIAINAGRQYLKIIWLHYSGNFRPAIIIWWEKKSKHLVRVTI